MFHFSFKYVHFSNKTKIMHEYQEMEWNWKLRIPQSKSCLKVYVCDNQDNRQADPWAALWWGSWSSPNSGRPLCKGCSVIWSDHELEEVLYQNSPHTVYSPTRSPSTATHSTWCSSLHTSILSVQMILRSKARTTVPPKPAAPLVKKKSYFDYFNSWSN